MKLTEFKVENFRSVTDSGWIKVGELTSLVGRNESGKSNLLLALQSLNPPGGRKELSPIKDFPRHRRLEECTSTTSVVSTRWDLTDEETEALRDILGAEQTITKVEVGRRYGTTPWVSLIGATPPSITDKDAKASIRKLDPVVTAEIERAGEAGGASAQAAWTAFKSASGVVSVPKTWAANTTRHATTLRAELGKAGVMLSDAADEAIADLEERATAITAYEATSAEARSTVAGWLPLFVYVSDFPELNGHQDIDRYMQNRANGVALTEAEKNFDKLAKVADFDAKKLHALRQSGDHETRSQLLNRASALVTGEIRRLWKDRSLTVRFNLDGPHLDTLVSDPNEAYPVEVNLDERSRGFRWFFSFHITFSADTHGGDADGAILLLDEPGLYLHAKSQEDLLRHFRQDLPNQIIYTTHSPFMVPPDDISVVRTVNISQETGTTVTNDPTGDSRTLFPLQTALGYHISQTLFVGNSNLLVEGITDFWVLSSVNNHLRASGRTALEPEMVITPAGGAGKISYMVALLSSQQLNVIVLLDDEKAGREAQKELVTSKMIHERAVMFVSEALPQQQEADIEDLLDASVYEALVRDTYKAELKGKKLTLNPQIPRIVKRFELAFSDLGLVFNKTRPAREFMSRMGSGPEKMVPEATLQAFEKLFASVNQRYKRASN